MDRIIRKRYKVKIILKSPLHISSGIGGAEYSRTVMDGNNPFIPGSTIKGKLRENFIKLIGKRCEEVEKSGYCNCPVCFIFGRGGYQPARIFVEDFKLQGDKKALVIRPRVSIDRYRRVANDGSLSNTEVVESGTFNGSIEVYFTPETEKYEKELLIGLKMIETIGGGKSRGFGFVNVEVESCE